MVCIAPRDTDFAVDLESGGTISEEDGSKDTVLGVKQAKMFFAKVCGGSFMGEDGLTIVANAGEVSAENVKLLNDKKVEGEESVDLVEKKTVKEKNKKTSAKKPPKPPRPPRGPSLDAADQKLIKEIAMLKRARIERVKALKKLKAAKASSSNSNLFAMLFTVFFCLVIIFQGMSSGSCSLVSFQGSPSSAVETEHDLISIQYYLSPSASNTNGPGSGSPNLVEQVSGLDPQEKVSRVAG